MSIKKVLRIVRNLILFFFISTILAVVLYRFIPVYTTPLMVIRSTQQLFKGEKPVWHHTWVSFDKISPHLPMAVIASEDNRFATHNGFDFEEIKKAMKENETRKRKRGASTISQQTAKNVFLWPQSSWVRKGFEVYFTWLIELCWSKERIMEVYLNSIEMGNGIYGAEAVAREHFHKNASKLTPEECALIAASLPNPRKFNSSRPGNYMLKRQKKILYLMKTNYYYCGHQCSAYLYQFLIELHRVVNLQNGSQDGQKLNQLQPVIDYIDKNFRKELTLVELADLIDLSPQYLCRLFKECLSLRPFEYLARKRIQQAKLLLLEDKLNINEIAAEVGYNDCSYFCAVFKKHEMLSPAEFRSLHKKAGN